ncbi:Protein of unknown function [Actinacidiphila alni]|uniref:DUF3311 domain-containing protein n=1 Tax=Actinacidiphila alni TaxID=380248 RepID=A0A1I2I633_9ACTN|nr:DUF3311 domain-containing protein [Actinacidiphila alni]SFF37073.1 Protein of unknown function [Actinacidiphila alni]
MPDAQLHEQAPRQPVVTPSRVIAGLCLLAPFVALLWVDSYSRITPTFIGIPFFYWYQMAWVPVAALLTYIAYVLVRREERQRKGGAAK